MNVHIEKIVEEMRRQWESDSMEFDYPVLSLPLNNLRIALTSMYERGAEDELSKLASYLAEFPDATLADYYADHITST